MKHFFQLRVWIVIILFGLLCMNEIFAETYKSRKKSNDSFNSCHYADSNNNNPNIIVTRDEMGVWFLNGPDDAHLYDIFYEIGYQVAMDRLWQLELYKRAATGTLSELLGEIYFENDLLVRTIGYSQNELQDGFEQLSEASKSAIQGYVDGINHRIDEVIENRNILPMAYVAFGVQAGINVLPSKWTVYDLLAWTVLLQRQFDPEALEFDHGQLDNIQLLRRLSEKYPTDASDLIGQDPGTILVGHVMFKDLRWTDDPDTQTYIIEEDVPDAWKTYSRKRMHSFVPITHIPDYSKAVNKLQLFIRRVKDNLQRIHTNVKMGSYAWVIGPERTRDGKPILYAGPQMGFDAPSICIECSIHAGGLNVSGMMIPGIPGIIIGRTPHHAWSMQVGHAHSTDIYFNFDAQRARFARQESIAIAGQTPLTITVYKIDGRPILSPSNFNPESYQPEDTNPIVSWRYSHIGHEFNLVSAMLDLAHAQSINSFGDGIEKLGFSQHFCYADKDGNIAYWMSGRDPIRPDDPLDLAYQLPQGSIPGVPAMDWDDDRLKPRSHLVNPRRGYFAGWNNKSHPYYSGSPNNVYYFPGPFHRSHIIYEYLDTHNDLTYENVRDLAISVATTDSIGKGGNPWPFVKCVFSEAVAENPTTERQNALNLLTTWDGHFVDGGIDNWTTGKNRADGWMLMDKWIRRVIEKTFEPYFEVLFRPVDNSYGGDDEANILFGNEYQCRLLNVIIRSFKGRCHYDWYNSNILLPPESDQYVASVQAMKSKAVSIIVEALDESLTELGDRPWGQGKRGYIAINHAVVTNVKQSTIYALNTMPDSMTKTYLIQNLTISNLWNIPLSSRSTYAQCVEFGSEGPERIESFFPLGQSGYINWQMLLARDTDPLFKHFTAPHQTNYYHKHFFDMSIKYFDKFVHRSFPLFGSPMYTIIPTYEGNGMIQPCSATGVQAHGNAQFTIIPDPGYEIDKIAVDGRPFETSENSYAFKNVTQNHTIHVIFSPENNMPSCPSWTTDDRFSNNMSFIGKVTLDGKNLMKGSTLAAFGPGGESDVRGTCPIDDYSSFFLNIRSTNQDNIVFKVFDKSSEKIHPVICDFEYDVQESIRFRSDTMVVSFLRAGSGTIPLPEATITTAYDYYISSKSETLPITISIAHINNEQIQDILVSSSQGEIIIDHTDSNIIFCHLKPVNATGRITITVKFQNKQIGSKHINETLPPPTNLTALQTANAIKLQWSPLEDLSVTYGVYRSQTENGMYYPIHSEPVDYYDMLINGFTDSNIEPNMPYYYKVKSIKSNLESQSFSNSVTATLIDQADYRIQYLNKSHQIIPVSGSAVFNLVLNKNGLFQGHLNLWCSNMPNNLQYHLSVNGIDHSTQANDIKLLPATLDIIVQFWFFVERTLPFYVCNKFSRKFICSNQRACFMP